MPMTSSKLQLDGFPAIGGAGNLGHIIAHRTSVTNFSTTITSSASYFDLLPTDFTIDDQLGFSTPSDGVFQWDKDYSAYFVGYWGVSGGRDSGSGNNVWYLNTALNGTELSNQDTTISANSLIYNLFVPFETNLTNGDQINLSIRNTSNTDNWYTKNIFLIGSAVKVV